MHVVGGGTFAFDNVLVHAKYLIIIYLSRGFKYKGNAIDNGGICCLDLSASVF
jgi:hypothetical protein